MKESDLMRAVQLEATKYGARLFRNNIGVLQDRRGRYIRYGLGTGSSDLIGWTKTGRFLAIEVKSIHGKLTEEQDNFLDQVSLAGGFALCVRSLQEVTEFFERNKAV